MTNWLRQLFCSHEWSWGERVSWVWPTYTATYKDWEYVQKCLACGALRSYKEVDA